MIINDNPYSVTGFDRAAGSVRPLLAGPVAWMSGVGVCPKHAPFAGTPASRTISGRLRAASVRRPVKINTFEFQPVLGSSDWREPV